MSNEYKLSYTGSKINNLLEKIDDINLEETLKDYLTKTELDKKGYLTEHQSLADYITKTELDNKGYLTGDKETDPTVP